MILKKLISNDKKILKVDAKLSHLKGNEKPYFSITGEVWAASKEGYARGRDCIIGGCIHDVILEHYPELSDIVALHLSDINGAPMYPVENGFYWFGGCPEYQAYNQKTFAEYVRISEAEAEALKKRIGSKISFRFVAFAHSMRFFSLLSKYLVDFLRQASSVVQDFEFYLERKAKTADRKALNTQKKLFTAWIESQRPIWKAEADACIKKHGLEIVKG
jgi:hypothetical protein